MFEWQSNSQDTIVFIPALRLLSYLERFGTGKRVCTALSSNGSLPIPHVHRCSGPSSSARRVCACRQWGHDVWCSSWCKEAYSLVFYLSCRPAVHRPPNPCAVSQVRGFTVYKTHVWPWYPTVQIYLILGHIRGTGSPLRQVGLDLGEKQYRPAVDPWLPHVKHTHRVHSLIFTKWVHLWN